MFDFGDEFTGESYRIPWLIWIQLIVLLLLLLLLFCFTVFPLDPADDAATAATTAPATASASTNRFVFNDIQQIDKPLPKRDSTATVLTNRRQHTQGGENLSIKGEIATGASMRREEIIEGEASSLCFHPCHYFQLARVAFLKCLGLDSTADCPSTKTHRKRKDR